MTSSSIYLTLILLFIQTCSIYGKDIVKGSLTFVLDDTSSMSYAIEQMKINVDSIFETAMNNTDSWIENVVLVTFNDPDTRLLIITKDRNEFKRDLSSIYPLGGGDTPENVMSGIKLALQCSLPNSLVYVFTDASAKDHTMLEDVRKRAQKDNIQVSFLLTGDRGSGADANYQVYHQLANATGGDIHIIEKNDIQAVTTIIAGEIKHREKIVIAEKNLLGNDKDLGYGEDKNPTQAETSRPIERETAKYEYATTTAPVYKYLYSCKTYPEKGKVMLSILCNMQDRLEKVNSIIASSTHQYEVQNETLGILEQ